jgi:hypothetical protein
MNLPKVITDLIKVQDNYDTIPYAKCFSETGKMFNEAKIHIGRLKILDWIALYTS